MTVSVLAAPLALKPLPEGLTDLVSLAREIEDRAADRRTRGRKEALEDWSSFVEEMKSGVVLRKGRGKGDILYLMQI